jgi:hypothetical protein
MASADNDMLQTFQKHIEDMRALVQCKICLKPFYEPFTLTCGHTYCYTCLSSWVGGSHNRGKPKNCPDCRAVISREPCPNYVLRDLVHMFMARVELLPEDETVQEHETGKSEEAEVLAADRSGRGLFKGVFSKRSNHSGHTEFSRLRFIVDPVDGVRRCPQCHWELEYGECYQCGYGVSDPSGDEVSEDDVSDRHMPPGYESNDQISNPDDLHYNLAYGSDEDSDDYTHYTRSVTNEPTHGAPFSPPYESESDDEETSEMDDFIDNDEDHDFPVEVDEDGVPRYHDYYNARDSDREEGDPSSSDTGNPHDYYNAHQTAHSSEADDYDSEGTPQVHSTYPRRGSFNETERVFGPYVDEVVSPSRRETPYDSDYSSVHEAHPTPIFAQVPRTRRRVMDSDDDDEDQSPTARFSSAAEDLDDSSGDSDSSDSEEESDDTARRPPQQQAVRRLRLHEHRLRRTNPGSRGYRGGSVHSSSHTGEGNGSRRASNGPGLPRHRYTIMA